MPIVFGYGNIQYASHGRPVCSSGNKPAHATAIEHDLFERLIAISGVGPKLALAVLSGIEPPELIRAVKLQDVARLTAIPGVGRKTAERIGLELKDRLPSSLQAIGQAGVEIAPEDQMRTKQ